MEKPNSHIDDLIIARLTGRLEPEEKRELDAWMAEAEEHRRYYMHCQEIWFSAVQERESERYDADRAFRLFQDKVADYRRMERNNTRPSRLSWMAWVRYAAVVAVLIGLTAYFSYRTGEHHLRNSLTDIEVQAPVSSQAHVRLPDGTSVVLNAGSRLLYAQDFGVDNRQIELRGEGYFEVAHNADIPFYVTSENLQVKVLGTKFNFRDYPEDKEAVVSLLEGKVSLHNELRQEKDRFLVPGERAVLNKKKGVMEIETAKHIVTDLNWRDGTLSFDETLLPEVISALERNYGVQVRLATDSLATYRFYGNFNSREQSLKEVLEALKATGKIRYTLKDKQVVLY